MYMPEGSNSLQNVIQAGLQLTEDPTSKHIAAYVEGLNKASLGMPTDDRWYWGPSEDSMYALSDNGVAFIPVWGTLINRFGWACPFLTGYNYVSNALSSALADSRVKGILFDVDSYGGEAQGCMEVGDEIFAARNEKPIVAVANSNALSAGYAIASSASRLTTMQSGRAGSVGVLLVHVDISGYLEKSGTKITILREGEHKADGNSYEPLSKDVRKDLQAMLGKCMDRFVALVSRNRGMSAESVRETEARVYEGAEALDVGFIDAVESPMASVTAFFNELSGSNSTRYAMTTPQKPGAQTAPNTETTTAVSETTTAVSETVGTKGETTASVSGAGAERARIRSILSSEEAKGREQMADHLAYSTSMSADDAKALLATAPKASSDETKKPNAFQEAMSNSENPNVGNDGPEAHGNAPQPIAALLQAYSQATGRDFK